MQYEFKSNATGNAVSPFNQSTVPVATTSYKKALSSVDIDNKLTAKDKAGLLLAIGLLLFMQFLSTVKLLK